MTRKATRTTAAVFAASLAVFSAIAVAVFTWESAARRDVQLVNWAHGNAPDWLVETMRVVTHLGSVFWLGPLALVAALVLLHFGRRSAAVLVLLGSVGSLLVDELLKAAFRRVRPEFEDPFVQLTTFSFPSGHAFGATVTYGALAIALMSTTTRRRDTAIVVAAIAIVVLVASSRVILGRHYVSDVIAGVAGGIALLAGLTLLLARFGRPVYVDSSGNEEPERTRVDPQL